MRSIANTVSFKPQFSNFATRSFRGTKDPLDVLHETTRQYLGLVTVEDLLDVRGKKSVVSIEPTDSVKKAMDKMTHHKCGSVCVMNQREMVGIFTDADISRIVKSEIDPEKCAIEDFMTQNVITGTLDMSVRDAMHLLANNRIRHLPVCSFHEIDNDPRIVDVISSRDFFYFLLG